MNPTLKEINNFKLIPILSKGKIMSFPTFSIKDKPLDKEPISFLFISFIFGNI